MGTFGRIGRQLASILGSLAALLAFLGSEFERGGRIQGSAHVGTDPRPPASPA